ncbi:hypothetical protein D3C72_1806840 [compost metagenome]
MHKAIFKNCFSDNTCSLSHSHQGHVLSLKIRCKQRMWSCCDINGFPRLSRVNRHRVFCRINFKSALAHFINQNFQVSWHTLRHCHFAFSDRTCDQQSSRFNTICHDSVFSRFQFFNAINSDNACTLTRDLCTHLIEIISKIHNLWFFSSIFENRATLSQSGCHHHVLCSTHSDSFE